MLRWFICPDGIKTEVSKCYEKCRMPSRCAPRAYLKLVGKEREWTGKPSVTQLINGTRQSFLELTTEFAEDPSEATFRVIGTRAHGRIESGDDDKTIMEERLEFDGITGAFDQLEFEDGKMILIDTKTSGSYKVAKALGFTTEKYPVPVLDEHGNQQYYKSGAKKGQQKTKQETKIIQGKPDMHDWVLQQNMYRIMVEHAMNDNVAKMQIFCLPRDGGTFTAKNRGVNNNMYMIDVEKIDDKIIIDYFMKKKDALLDAIATMESPAMCNDEENWDGRKCEKFCSVKDACRAIGDNRYLEGE